MDIKPNGWEAKMLDKNYWDKTYENKQPGWDVGYAATPLQTYFDQLTDKSLRILVPGAGNAYEVEYLFRAGFKNIFLLDFAPTPISNFLKRNPDFPTDHIIQENFFDHHGQYNLIIEHTFLTSFPKNIREKYAVKMHELLTTKGKFVGIIFNHEFGKEFPPYGGTPEEYESLFKPYFNFKVFEVCYNSIKPRQNREHFFILTKK